MMTRKIVIWSLFLTVFACIGCVPPSTNVGQDRAAAASNAAVINQTTNVSQDRAAVNSAANAVNVKYGPEKPLCGGGFSELPAGYDARFAKLISDKGPDKLKYDISFFSFTYPADDLDEKGEPVCRDLISLAAEDVEPLPAEGNQWIKSYISAEVANEVTLIQTARIVGDLKLANTQQMALCVDIECGKTATSSGSKNYPYQTKADIEYARNVSDTYLVTGALNVLSNRYQAKDSTVRINDTAIRDIVTEARRAAMIRAGKEIH